VRPGTPLKEISMNRFIRPLLAAVLLSFAAAPALAASN
jgi:hypothetical protein